MVKVVVQPRGKPSGLTRKLPATFEFPGNSGQDVTVAQVKAAIQTKYPKFYSTRQGLYAEEKGKLLIDESTLPKQASDTVTLLAKDLGPQISWTTVFIIEYIGPLVIHPLVYNFPQLFYGQPVQHSQMQTFAYILVLLHFLKREYETVFVHRFSLTTMPARNIFKNSAHYYILGGIVLAGGLYGPWYSERSLQHSITSDPVWLWSFTALFAFAELSNLWTHYTLRNLRPPGTRSRGIPRGYLFNLVSCPNYFFETLAWTAFALLTLNPFVLPFLFVSIWQMIPWAFKKHRAYKREFGDKYPRGRKVMFPFLL